MEPDIFLHSFQKARMDSEGQIGPNANSGQRTSKPGSRTKATHADEPVNSTAAIDIKVNAQETFPENRKVTSQSTL